MKLTIAILLLAVAMPLTAGDEDPQWLTDAQQVMKDSELLQARAKVYCAEEWGSDYTMRKYCLGKQVDGFVRAAGLMQETNKIDQAILQNALIDWHLPEHRTFDWSMVAYTLKKQLEAARD